MSAIDAKKGASAGINHILNGMYRHILNRLKLHEVSENKGG